jgi:hypothetical protein
MAIKSLKSGTFSRSGLVGNPVIMPGSYESIATTTVGASAVSSITFSSIPATYTHLQLRGSALCSSNGGNIQIRFNSDTGSNYSMHYIAGGGASVIVGATASTTAITLCEGVNGTSSTFPAGVVTDVLDYTNTNKYTTIRSLGGQDSNNGGRDDIGLFSGAWLNTAAITSIVILPSGNFNQYTQFALYGIA